VLREINAVAEPDARAALREFDSAFFGHIAFVASNKVRAFWMGLTGARLTSVPSERSTRRYFQHLTRLSSAFAFASDIAMFVLGGSLKRRERLSARLGDILSALYLASAALKRYEDDGRPEEDLPLLHWSMQDTLCRAQEAFYGLFENMPRFWGAVLRLVVFPFGRTFRPPRDRLGHSVCALVLSPGPARDRLTAGMFISDAENDPLRALENALEAAIAAEPVEQKIRAARKTLVSRATASTDDIELALTGGILTREEAEIMKRARALRRQAIMVDDFPKDLGRTEIFQTTQPVRPQALHSSFAEATTTRTR
jgi:acyl-CoA dehydrogenase